MPNLNPAENQRRENSAAGVAETIHTEPVPYLTKEVYISGLIDGGSLSAEKATSLAEKLDNMELEELHFSVHLNAPEGSSVAEALHADPKRPVLVMLHGWTGSEDIYTSLKIKFQDENGQVEERTYVEEMLRRNPDLIIVTMDGLGFGESQYKQGLSPKKLKESTTIKAYEEQVDFVLSEALELGEEDKERILIVGHSFGGAACITLAAEKGYNTIPVAPAFLPTRQNIREINDVIFHNMEVAATGLGKKKLSGEIIKDPTVRTTYGALGAAVGAGALVGSTSEISRNAMDETVGFFYSRMLGKPLMGASAAGDIRPENGSTGGTEVTDFSYIFTQLNKLHEVGLNKSQALTALTMVNLAEGMDVSHWREEEALNIDGHVKAVITGEKDLLAPDSTESTARAIAGYVAKNSLGKVAVRPGIERDPSAIVSSAIARRGYQVAGAGHYAALYANTTFDVIEQHLRNMSRVKTEGTDPTEVVEKVTSIV